MNPNTTLTLTLTVSTDANGEGSLTTTFPDGTVKSKVLFRPGYEAHQTQKLATATEAEVTQAIDYMTNGAASELGKLIVKRDVVAALVASKGFAAPAPVSDDDDDDNGDDDDDDD